MITRRTAWLHAVLVGWFLAGALTAKAAPQITTLTDALVGHRVAFRLDQAPASSNPFDPDLIQVDATFTAPSGRAWKVPAFWYQEYQRALQNGVETLAKSGAPFWQIRFTPLETGEYTVSVAVATNGVSAGEAVVSHFMVASNTNLTRTGFVRVAGDRQYFETGDGQPLPLNGACVCWHGQRGTRDYDDWFGAMSGAGENYARLWMWPYAFGIEAEPNTLLHYRLDRAWQLDYVFDLAEREGIYLLLCLDYHGMFQTKPDMWGANNLWTNNPYNTLRGGPCAKPNDFFTNAVARKTYEKRLRYLIGRYGASPNLLAWEFFNEIDNVYDSLKAADVAAWHSDVGNWLHTQDPFGHLVTTSLTGSSDRAEIWNLSQMDFTSYHSYGEANPAVRMDTVAQSFLTRYKKPVMIGEYGVNAAGWSRAQDPYLRGWRQGLWGGALSGSVGTGMSWWWEELHAANTYAYNQALKSILSPAAWGHGAWTAIQFKTSGSPPITVTTQAPGTNAALFDITLTPGGAWGGSASGQLAVPNPDAGSYAATTFNAFVHGQSHTDLRHPFIVSAWFGPGARLVAHVNSVSEGAIVAVRVDGVERYRTNLPNLDGSYAVNNEYNKDFGTSVPEGRHLVELYNPGGDWFYVDWVRVEKVETSAYDTPWEPSPTAIGLRRNQSALVYAIAPNATYPAGATNAVLPTQSGKFLTLAQWPEGAFDVQWLDSATGVARGRSSAITQNGLLQLPMPAFSEDLVGRVLRKPELGVSENETTGLHQLVLSADPGAVCVVEKSTELFAWADWQRLTNASNSVSVDLDLGAWPGNQYFRARRVESDGN